MGWRSAPAWAGAQAAAEDLRSPSAGEDEGQKVPAPSVAEDRRPVAKGNRNVVSGYHHATPERGGLRYTDARRQKPGVSFCTPRLVKV